jgi:hypothetical protein
LRLRRGDRTRNGGFFLRQLGNGQFLGATNRNANNAFVFVDPSVSVQRPPCVFVCRFQIFQPFFRPRLFIITSARRGPNYREHDYPKQCEEKDDP